jgi:tRNA G37 N-methylase Trm5
LESLQFPLFSSHLDLAHQYWAALVKGDDIVIDATCGNGYDTLALAKLKPKKLYALDIQKKALDSAGELVNKHLSVVDQEKINWILTNHVVFPSEILDRSVKLIVYNLGYLPKGDKSIMTRAETTLQSLKNALTLLTYGGCVSLTCYPGHPEGAQEEKDLLEYTTQLPPKEWSCCHHRWLNRSQSPSLLIIQKIRDLL